MARYTRQHEGPAFGELAFSSPYHYRPTTAILQPTGDFDPSGSQSLHPCRETDIHTHTHETTAQSEVRYLCDDGITVAVACRDDQQAHAVRSFAELRKFPCPPPKSDKARVYHCNAKTHPNGEILWG